MQLKHRQRRLRLRRAAGRTTMRNLSIPETSTAIRIRWEMCRMNRRRLETVKRLERAETPEQRIMPEKRQLPRKRRQREIKNCACRKDLSILRGKYRIKKRFL